MIPVSFCASLHSKVKQENWTMKPFVHGAAIHMNKARPTVLGYKLGCFFSSIKTRGASRDCISSCCLSVSARSTCPAVLFPSRSSHSASHLHLHRKRAKHMTRWACLLSKLENDAGSQCCPTASSQWEGRLHWIQHSHCVGLRGWCKDGL